MAATKLLLSLFFVVIHFVNIEAQEIGSQANYKKSNYAYWGLGWGGQKSARNFGFVSQVSQERAIAITFQRTWLADLVPGPMVASSASEVKQTTSAALSVLYGIIIKRSWGHSILMAGPSIVRATKYNDLAWGTYYPESVGSIGLLLQAGVMPSIKFMGMGANLFANINGAFTYGGITINFALGNVNYKKTEE